jgi:hypothetical protein
MFILAGRWRTTALPPCLGPSFLAGHGRMTAELLDPSEVEAALLARAAASPRLHAPLQALLAGRGPAIRLRGAHRYALAGRWQ